MTRTVDTDDGIAIEYEVYGTGQLTLLFLHGWGNAASAWDDFLTAHLNLTGLRCVAASYRGHGGSGTARSGYTTNVLRATCSPSPMRLRHDAL